MLSCGSLEWGIILRLPCSIINETELLIGFNNVFNFSGESNRWIWSFSLNTMLFIITWEGLFVGSKRIDLINSSVGMKTA